MMNYKDYIAIIEDFPVKGISFKDITPLMQNGDVFKKACEELTNYAKKVGATVIVGPESRGFIFGCPVATNLGIGFVPIRKPGKLPREEIRAEYSLEYGKNTLCMHADAIKQGDKVLIYKQKLKPPLSLFYKHSDLDMGIALCHYALACKETGKPFRFSRSAALKEKAGFLPFGVIE